MVCAATRHGASKVQSEDTIVIGGVVACDEAVQQEIPVSGAVCVADGVGGNVGGRFASSYVADRLKMFAAPDSAASAEDIQQRLIEINLDLIEEGKAAGYPKAATTLTGIIFAIDEKHIVHIGNTRAYVLQGQYLKQLTTDHTVYERLLRMGRIDEASRCGKNEITNCLGGGNASLAGAIHVFAVQDFNVILLTSDGVHDFVGLDELEKILSSDKTGCEKCESILRAAVCAGSMDDISVVIISTQEG